MSNAGLNLSTYVHVGEPTDEDGIDNHAEWCAMMRAGSERMARALGYSWPCNHLRTPENTHTIAGNAQCKTCRRRRWNKGFKIACARRRMMREAREGAAISRAERDRMMRELVARPGNGRFPLDVLLQNTADMFGLTIAEIQGARRSLPLPYARSVVAKILRERGVSLPKIGSLLGGRDHQTIINSLAKFPDYARKSPIVLQAYEALRDKPNG